MALRLQFGGSVVDIPPPPSLALQLPPSRARPIGAVSGVKLEEIQCRARGGEMVLGRCVLLSRTVALPSVPVRVAARPVPIAATVGETEMPIRTQLLAGAPFLPTGAGAPLLGTLLQGGIDIVSNLLAAKFGGVGVTAPGALTSSLVQPGGGLIQAGGIPAGLGISVIGPAIIAAGGRIVGTVIQISRAAWAAIPSLVKQAAIALGLTVAFTDIEVDLFGGGGTGMLSQAQQRKIAKFQAMTSAGVPPNIAARATSIGKKRRRGISAFELSGFRKISHLLGHVGMVPRGLRGARPHRGHHHS